MYFEDEKLASPRQSGWERKHIFHLLLRSDGCASSNSADKWRCHIVALGEGNRDCHFCGTQCFHSGLAPKINGTALST